jgi:hypothetical protein
LIDVYEDTLYHTFLFVSETSGNGIPPQEAPVLTGLVNVNGHPATFQTVTVTLPNGHHRRVRTNAHGVYRLYRAPAGQVTVTVGTHSSKATLGTHGTVKKDFAL